MKRYLPIFSGITFATIFGFSFMFTKEGLEKVSPFYLLAYRFGLAALALTVLAVLGIIKLNFRGKRMGLLIILSLAQPVFYFICETMGINLTNSSQAGLMIALIPVVVTILAIIFLQEKPSKLQIFFIILSVVGVLFIILLEGISSSDTNFLGFLFLMGAVLMAGIYNILSRKLSLKFTPVEITFVMMWTGAIVFHLLALIKDGILFSNYLKPLTDVSVLISVFYLGLLSSVLAFFMVNYTLSRIEAAQSAVFANLTTVISILAGVFFRGEPFYWFQIIGGIMIIIGVWGTNYFGREIARAEEIPA